MSRLESSTERIGHRLRTITSGGRAKRQATQAELDAAVAYLDKAADELERHALVVDAIAIDARKPMTARLTLRGRGQVGRAVQWQQDFGWSIVTHEGPDAPPEGWFHLLAEPAADPPAVARFVLNT